MRIITGKAKGRRLIGPDTPETRPVTDRVREAVFSIVGGWVEEAAVLDLYAGSGSFGLEALSRGARTVTFVENGHRALEALRKNIATVGLGGTVVTTRVQEFLSRSAGIFDLVFIDPPWTVPSSELSKDLYALDALLAPQAEVILSRRHGDETPDSPESWRVATDRRYGDTRIVRYEKEADLT
ncbi:MAG TPA: 16S rRNA (guanine(966)-N(2))-methyltransferase RsmD [Acidimicrobiia bacterium]|nr:16S rRNA (guanine(966)-N(2))-methyltransferase RsmD [Acidimicrobiia bacterium]